MEWTGLRERYQRAGQEHVLDSWDYLSGEDRSKLLTQLDEIQVEALPTLLECAKLELSSIQGGKIQAFKGPIGRSNDEVLRERSRNIGLEAIRNHRVAAIVSLSPSECHCSQQCLILFSLSIAFDTVDSGRRTGEL